MSDSPPAGLEPGVTANDLQSGGDTRRPVGSVLKANASYIAFGIAALLAVTGGITWLLSRPEPRRIEIVIPTPAPVIVHVEGAVAAPGVYQLPRGSRVRDAVAAAGGMLAGALASSVNLASELRDGSRIDVYFAASSSDSGAPALGIPELAGQAAGPTGGVLPAGTACKSGQLVDLNAAMLDELDTLPEIGPALAQRIIDYRAAHGPFQTSDDLLEVSGIGVKTVEALRSCVVQG